ncbi:MAG: prolipoprotein diacylglyceryl transferase [Deltaproteobacteria bacterium RBG_13_52_11]|nr:MAG: prolipoprotein diacylglyceryl transferase [Deltaproteobacteria bacterium RBG_13_52_11]
MHPVLFHSGWLTIYSYGFMIALGIMVGLFLARRQAAREGIDPNQIVDITFYVLVAALIGARILFVLMNFKEYADNPINILKIWEGGLVFYGGLVPAAAIGIWYIKRLGLPLWQVADIFAPSVAISHAFGRIGCFFAGCCYGEACALPWAVTFTDPRSLAPQGIPLHPTQLYSSLSLFALFAFLVLLRKRKTFHGELLWLYILCYSIGRFFLEFLRGDPRGNVLGGLLSTAQAISIPLAGISVVMLLYLRIKRQ